MLRPLAVLSVLSASVLCQGLTFGNLYVVRVGDGAAALSSAATVVYVDEYTQTGVLVQSIPMPTVASGTNYAFTNAGSSTSEGFLNQSSNGIYLTLAGYTAAPGTLAVPTTVASATPRVIGRIDLGGSVDTATTLTDGYNGGGPGGSNGNIRAVVSDDGNNFWTAGTGPSGAGIRYVTYGANTSVGLNAGNPLNTRVVGIHAGQLYTTSASGAYQGVNAVGAGLPTTNPQSITLLNGFPTASGPSAYDFWFADAITLYVADDRAVANGGGIQKWTLAGGTWTLAYTLGVGSVRGLTGLRAGGFTTLWATTGSSIVVVADSGPGATGTVIATAGANTAFRGIRLLRKPSTLQRISPAACGPLGIDTVGTGEIGTDMVVTLLDAVSFPFISYGLNLVGAPFCGCGTQVHDLIFTVAGAQHIFATPPNPTLAGVSIFVQGIDWMAPGGCPGPMLTASDGYVFTIQ